MIEADAGAQFDQQLGAEPMESRKLESLESGLRDDLPPAGSVFRKPSWKEPAANETQKTTDPQFHLAIHGRTAAELIMQRGDSSKLNMGLTSWQKAPNGKILKTDVAIAKNYLTKEELESLGRIVNAYLDLAEDRARRRIPMTMEDCANREGSRRLRRVSPWKKR